MSKRVVLYGRKRYTFQRETNVCFRGRRTQRQRKRKGHLENVATGVMERIEKLQGYIDTLKKRTDDPVLTDLEVYEQLSTALEELQVAEEELLQQNAMLMQAQEGLERERGRYRDLFEFAPDGYLVTDDLGVIREANRAAERLLGKPADFLRGKPLSVYLRSSAQHDFRQVLRRLTNQEVSETPEQPECWELQLRTGNEGAMQGATVEIKVARSLEGKNVTLRWGLRDISERKEMEHALRRSQLRFRQAFRIGPVAAIITSLEEARLLEVNSAFERLTGYGPEEALGRTSETLGLWASAEDQAAIEKAADERGAYREVELCVKTKDRGVRNILSSTEVIALNGEDGMLHMFYDITSRKQSEEELMHAINTVMQDTAWFSRSVVEKLTQLQSGELHPETASELTKREWQVLERVAQGHSNEMISDDLGIAKQTVRNYVTRVYEKLGVHTRAEAVVWARERGLSG